RQTAPFPRPLKKTQNRPLQRADEGGGAGPAPEARAAERGLRRPEKRRRKASLHVDRGAQPPVSQHEPGQYCQLQKLEGEPRVEIHPADAARHGIADGETVRLFNRRGSCILKAKVTETTLPGVLISNGLWWGDSTCDGK